MEKEQRLSSLTQTRHQQCKHKEPGNQSIEDTNMVYGNDRPLAWLSSLRKKEYELLPGFIQ